MLVECPHALVAVLAVYAHGGDLGGAGGGVGEIALHRETVVKD